MYRILLTIAITLAFAAWGWWQMQENDLTSKTATSSSSSGQALIGGEFELIDENGKPFSNKQLLGRNGLIFFGFTHCPDMCPTSLTAMTEAMYALGDEAKALMPIFITVDPDRDTPEVMKKYKENFHPDLIMLTGDKERINEVIKAYRVFSSKNVTDGQSGMYLMDHSGFTYLMDTKGQYVAHYPPFIEPEDLTAKLKNDLANAK